MYNIMKQKLLRVLSLFGPKAAGPCNTLVKHASPPLMCQMNHYICIETCINHSCAKWIKYKWITTSSIHLYPHFINWELKSNTVAASMFFFRVALFHPGNNASLVALAYLACITLFNSEPKCTMGYSFIPKNSLAPSSTSFPNYSTLVSNSQAKCKGWDAFVLNLEMYLFWICPGKCSCRELGQVQLQHGLCPHVWMDGQTNRFRKVKVEVQCTVDT